VTGKAISKQEWRDMKRQGYADRTNGQRHILANSEHGTTLEAVEICPYNLQDSCGNNHNCDPKVCRQNRIRVALSTKGDN